MLTSGEHAYKFKMQHRDVMEHSLGRPLRADEIIHHINGDKKDNRIENLKIMTRAEHLRQHIAEITKNRRGERIHTAVLNERQVREIRKSKASSRQLGKIYGVNKSTVLAIISRKTWIHVS